MSFSIVPASSLDFFPDHYAKRFGMMIFVQILFRYRPAYTTGTLYMRILFSYFFDPRNGQYVPMCTGMYVQSGSIDFPRRFFSRRRRFSPPLYCFSAYFLRYRHHLHCGKDFPNTMFQGVQHVFLSMITGIRHDYHSVLQSRKLLCFASF